MVRAARTPRLRVACGISVSAVARAAMALINPRDGGLAPVITSLDGGPAPVMKQRGEEGGEGAWSRKKVHSPRQPEGGGARAGREGVEGGGQKALW